MYHIEEMRKRKRGAAFPKTSIAKLRWGPDKNENLMDRLFLPMLHLRCNRRAGALTICEDFSMARNMSVTPVQSLSAGEIFRENFQRKREGGGQRERERERK